MTTPRTIKDLTIQAISLLELAYLYPPQSTSRTSRPRTPQSETLAVQRFETIAFCASHGAANAVALADVTTTLALVHKVPTLVVITRYPPILFAFTLLLRRAGGHPRDIFALGWTQAVFSRLTAAARNIAGAPIHVVGSPSVNISWRSLLALPGNHRTSRIITDAHAQAIPHLQNISRAFGVPITAISVTPPSQ